MELYLHPPLCPYGNMLTHWYNTAYIITLCIRLFVEVSNMNFIKVVRLFCSRRVQRRAYRLLMYVSIPEFRTSYFMAHTLKYIFLGASSPLVLFEDIS
jgi:hypothetical protein